MTVIERTTEVVKKVCARNNLVVRRILLGVEIYTSNRLKVTTVKLNDATVTLTDPKGQQAVYFLEDPAIEDQIEDWFLTAALEPLAVLQNL